MRITILDYGLGNLASVANALNSIDIPFEISRDTDVLNNATALILPGVGSASQGMRNLKERKLDEIIIKKVKTNTPILGICLGMQLFLSSSNEGNIKCMALIQGNVQKINTNLKVPQIGWNQVRVENKKSKILKNIPDNSYFYFVNSYICNPDDTSIVSGTTAYGDEFCSVYEKDNLFGTQFHPEKSGDIGLQLLRNFWEVL